MNNKVKYGIVIAILLSALYGFGPVVELDETIEPLKLPDDIESFLRNSEKQFSDIRPGTEKTIVWQDPLKRNKTPISIVYLHGFSATRQEIAPLCDQLAAKLGANLYYTRLTGHGRTGDAMGDVTVNTLLNDAVQALEIGKTIGDKVILIGTSTGGTLATWLASHDDNHSILAMVILSPNFGPKRSESELLLLPFGNLILQLVEGDTYHFNPLNAAQEQFWTTRYPSRAFLPMMGLIKLTRGASLKHISAPTLVLYAEDDAIVDVTKMKNTVANFGAPILQTTAIEGTGDPQHHILAGDVLSPQTTDLVLEKINIFLRPLI